ncbi:hypothetical protein ABN125_17510, partial [Proteus terrae]|uniref:hypothetical protein n=1 Tax=Proteus terrae TaxID=1574161 RepID=UPI0032DA510E
MIHINKTRFKNKKQFKIENPVDKSAQSVRYITFSRIQRMSQTLFASFQNIFPNQGSSPALRGHIADSIFCLRPS